jgi:hypothetical protein
LEKALAHIPLKTMIILLSNMNIYIFMLERGSNVMLSGPLADELDALKQPCQS